MKKRILLISIVLLAIAALSITSVKVYADVKEKQKQDSISECELRVNNEYDKKIKSAGTPMYINGHDGMSLSVEEWTAINDQRKSDLKTCSDQ